MALVESAFVSLFRSKLISEWSSIGGNPSSPTSNPFFTNFCTAIGGGFVERMNMANFNTADTGLGSSPTIPGVGTGVGLNVDKSEMHRLLYIRTREKCNDLAATLSRTSGHPPWPQADETNFLYLLCKALSDTAFERLRSVLVQ